MPPSGGPGELSTAMSVTAVSGPPIVVGTPAFAGWGVVSGPRAPARLPQLPVDAPRSTSSRGLSVPPQSSRARKRSVVAVSASAAGTRVRATAAVATNARSPLPMRAATQLTPETCVLDSGSRCDGRDDPRRRRPHDPRFGDELAEPGAQRVLDDVVQVGRPFPLEPQDLARRPERHYELERLLDVAADEDRDVAAVQRDVLIAGELEDVAGRVRAGHRERSRATGGLVVLLRPLDDLLGDHLRAVQPVVVLAPAPDDHHEAPTRHQRLPDVAHRCTRVAEEHRSHAREGHVVGAAEGVRLDVGPLEARVGDAQPGRLAPRGLDELRSGVHADRLTLCAHQPGDPLRRVAEPAADVDDALAPLRRVQRQPRLAVRAETGGDDLAKLHKTVIERPIPRLDRLIVGVLDRISAHGPILLLARRCVQL